MKLLKSLTFGVMSRGSQNPVLARRAKLVHRLEQQKRLAQDANFVVTVSRWLRNDAGSKELVKHAKAGASLVARGRAYSRADGALRGEAIEFEKGRPL